jgi:prepilin-type N-terminal cleavage/methylation domain-containing protein
MGERNKEMRKQKGFSLIELLIVVAIILIIAAIAIPNLLRSRIAANEASAVGSVRTINTAQVTYASAFPDIGFASALSNLAGSSCTPGTASSSSAACLIDNVLGNGTKSGYTFAVGGTSGTPVVTYTVNANPVTIGSTGQRGFYSDQSGVIRYNPSSTASSSDKPLQ